MIIISILQHEVNDVNATHFKAINCNLYSAADKCLGEYELDDLSMETDVRFKGRLDKAKRKYMMMTLRARKARVRCWFCGMQQACSTTVPFSAIDLCIAYTSLSGHTSEQRVKQSRTYLVVSSQRNCLLHYYCRVILKKLLRRNQSPAYHDGAGLTGTSAWVFPAFVEIRIHSEIFTRARRKVYYYLYRTLLRVIFDGCTY